MNTLDLIGDWIIMLGFLIGLPLGTIYLHRWVNRTDRKRFNLKYGKSLSKKEIRKARRIEAREDRRRFWRKAVIAALPLASIRKVRRAEENLGDEDLAGNVYDGLLFGIFLAWFFGVVGGFDWLSHGGLMNPLAWLVLLWGVAGAVLSRRFWRFTRAFQWAHDGRLPGQEPGGHSAKFSERAWERQQAFRADVARTGLKPRQVRKMWEEQGLL